MKKLYFLISVFSLSIAADAQYSMTNFHNIAPGDMEVQQAPGDTLAQQGPGGANQTWNFSALALGAPSTGTYSAPSSTPFAANYPNATVANGTGSGPFGYLKFNATSYSVEGVAQTNSITVYTNDQLMITYPFTYNSTLTDAFSGTVTSGQNGTLTGSSTTTGDGYGTLMLPNGTYNNVLRVKNVYSRTDNYGAYTIDYYAETYLWYSASSKFPILNINRIATTFFGTTTWAKSVVVNANPVGINENAGSPAFGMFPNPASGQVFLKMKPELMTNTTRVEIMDLMGKTVSAKTADKLNSIGEGFCSLNIDELPKGTYFVRISSDKESTVQKLLIQ